MGSLIFTPVIFLFISFIFSMLGMGGSQIYIPVLFWLGMDFKTEAIPLGMLLNVVNSASAAVTYGRAKIIDYEVAIPFGIAMILFPPFGTWLNVNLPTKPIILIFALFTASAGILILSGWKPQKGKLSKKGRILLGILSGSILGFLAGLIGRGGGSFVVPLLYIAGLEAKNAAATSAFIVTGSGLSSFISHIVTAAHPYWLIWGLCVLAVLIGSQSGSRLMAKKMKSRSIKIVFGFVLLMIATILIIKDVLY